jgi:uncharacterized protein YbjT (DUF2867 family)
MKILVAGATGLVGGEVARLLKERGHNDDQFYPRE